MGGWAAVMALAGGGVERLASTLQRRRRRGPCELMSDGRRRVVHGLQPPPACVEVKDWSSTHHRSRDQLANTVASPATPSVAKTLIHTTVALQATRATVVWLKCKYN